MPQEGPRDWMPKLDEAARRSLENRIRMLLNEIIAKQRKITDYKGPDEGFSQFVAEGSWDTELHDTIFNSGYLYALLDFAKMLHIELPKDLAERADAHINEIPYDDE